MSDFKSPKKAETVSKKTESKKPETTSIEVKKTDPVKSDAVKSEFTKTEAATSEASGSDNKPDAKPQSASQSSISHFSSVSTPEYRQGWEQIFGTRKNTNITDQKTKNDFLDQLSLTDTQIDVTLRSALERAFEAVAQKQGHDFEEIKRLASIEYTITCDLRK
jgi:hypothetical protein